MELVEQKFYNDHLKTELNGFTDNNKTSGSLLKILLNYWDI